MDEGQHEGIKELKKHLQELDDALSLQERLLQERSQCAAALSQSVVEAEGAVNETEAELKVERGQLEDAVKNNRVARAGREGPGGIPVARLPRDEYMRELSEAEASLAGAKGRVHGLVDQVEALNEAAGDVDTRRRLTLVSLISMLDDLHASLSRSVEQGPRGEDARARVVFKAIRELSRERERAIGYCLRRKREMEDVIRLKKQRANELLCDARRNQSPLREDWEGTPLSVAEQIQTERNALQEEIESIKSANQRLWEALRDTKYSSDTLQTGDHKRETTISANDALHETAGVEGEKEHLREQLKLFDAKRTKLQRMTEELRASINAESEKHALKLRDLRREIEFQQRESHKIEQENQKLKSLCDSLAAELGV